MRHALLVAVLAAALLGAHAAAASSSLPLTPAAARRTLDVVAHYPAANLPAGAALFLRGSPPYASWDVGIKMHNSAEEPDAWAAQIDMTGVARGATRRSMPSRRSHALIRPVFLLSLSLSLSL